MCVFCVAMGFHLVTGDQTGDRFLRFIEYSICFESVTNGCASVFPQSNKVCQYSWCCLMLLIKSSSELILFITVTYTWSSVILCFPCFLVFLSYLKMDFVFSFTSPCPTDLQYAFSNANSTLGKKKSAPLQFLILLPSVYLLVFVGIAVNMFFPSIIKEIFNIKLKFKYSVNKYITFVSEKQYIQCLVPALPHHRSHFPDLPYD